MRANSERHSVGRLCLVALLSVASSVAAIEGSDLFYSPRIFSPCMTACERAFALATADFNGDRRPDLAFVGHRPDSVAIMLGSGDGTFQPAVDYPLGLGPKGGGGSVIAVDLNHDAESDLVIGANNALVVVPGHGDGTFGPPLRYELNPGAFLGDPRVAAGDFNGDGSPDLAASTGSILLGNGDGTFRATTRFETPERGRSVAVADFNGDGNEDLVVGNQNTYLSVLLGNGDGSFQPSVNYVLQCCESTFSSVAVADFNGDGTLDLVAPDSNAFFVLLGNPDGSFQTPVHYFDHIGDLAIAVDIDADGNIDLVLSGGGHGFLFVLLGRGDGTFEPPRAYGVGSSNRFVLADFNGDAKWDAAVAGADGSPNAGGFAIVLGHGDGSFQRRPNYVVGDSPRSLAVGDFNGDRIWDLVTANSGSDNISVLLGSPNGGFQPSASYPTAGRPYGVAVGEFNGDGRYDLAVASPYDSVSILVGNGDGTFRTREDYSVDFYPDSLAVGDFNRDGRLDVAVATYRGGTAILLGHGDGTFQAAAYHASGGSSWYITVGDFDGDFRHDLAVANRSHNSITILLNNGDATFRSSTISLPGVARPMSIAVGDFNGDRIEDLAAAVRADPWDEPDSSSNTVFVLAGRGDGTFHPPQVYPVGLRPTSIAKADFNRDRRIDLAVVSEVHTLSILLGNGDGTFQAPIPYAEPFGPAAVVSGYFNYDGWPDLAIVNYGSDTVAILINATPWLGARPHATIPR